MSDGPSASPRPSPFSSSPIIQTGVTARTSPVAACSLVLGILSFVCLGGFFTAIPAIICGHVARSGIRKSGGAVRGMGVATTGLVMGYVAFAFFFIITAVAIPYFYKADKEAAARRAATTREIVATDGHARFTIPGDWVEIPGLNQKASVQVGDKSKAQYLL